jgi:primosomal protein N' (replication factor Y)
MIADVVLVAGPRSLLSYCVPERMRANILPGCRVVVPLRNKKAMGVVWRLEEGERAENLKPIHELVDQTPLLSAEHIQLADWMSTYYFAPIRSVLRLFVPRLLMQPDGIAVRRTGVFPEAVEAAVRDLLLAIPERRAIKVSTLRRASRSQQSFYRDLNTLERFGCIEAAFKRAASRQSSDEVVSLSKPASEMKRLGFKQQRIVDLLMSSSKPIPLGAVLTKTGSSRKAVASLERRGIVTLKSKSERDRTATSVQELMLNSEQSEVVRVVSEAVGAGKFDVFLLHGVTGSGKTEVYVKLLWDAIETGRTAVLLQPEITLSEQVYSRLRHRFGEKVCRVHSQLPDSERYAAFKGMESGQVRVVIGPRSALFSPLRNIGLIIVDEEHDSSFKQGGSVPLYQGRDTAVVLGRISSCPVLLGSATPSLESWANVRAAKYRFLRLTTRWDEREMPEVKIVAYVPAAGDGSPLSDYLAERISQCLSEGSQVVLFLNRRGYAPTVKCLTCRSSLRCPNCDVGLVYHKWHRKVMCHLCGYREELAAACAVCGKPTLSFVGSGTQRVEDHIVQSFPTARVGRLDVDAIEAKGSAVKLLQKFGDGKIDILVGTQMVAKGLDFPNVRLAAVLAADAAMSLPDFRAAERAYSLVFQAAGRAGRGRFKGEVVIQVENESSPLMAITSGSDYCEFLDSELQRRVDLHYPPERHLILIKLASPSAESIERAAFELQARMMRMRRSYENFMQVLGPAPAPLFRVKNNFRWRLLVKTSSVLSSLSFIRDFFANKEIETLLRDTRVVVDVDPQDMM